MCGRDWSSDVCSSDLQNQVIDIYSASWGPMDNGKTMEAPGKYCSAALEQGTRKVITMLEKATRYSRVHEFYSKLCKL